MIESPESVILRTLREDAEPIRARQFAEWKNQLDMVLNHLQLQIVSLDCAIGLLLERIVPEEERAAFKAEVTRRIEAIAKTLHNEKKSDIVLN